MSEREFDAYLRLLGGLLRLAPQQREQIAGELRDHMEERLEALLAAGVPREEAIGQALEEFGDVAALAASFQQIAWNRKQRWMMRCTAASVCGMLVVILAATAFWPGNQPGPGAPSLARAQDNTQEAGEDPRMQTPEERNDATRAKLAHRAEGNFGGETLELSYFAEYFARTFNVQIHLEAVELANAGIDPKTTKVSLDLNDIRGDMMLDLVLEPIDCEYYLRDGIVIFTTIDKAQTQLELRVYDCAQLIAFDPVYSKPQPKLPAGDETKDGEKKVMFGGNQPKLARTEPDVSLVALIKSSTAGYGMRNQGWLDQGTGSGTICRYNDKIVVNQTQEVHQQIEQLLEGLRVSGRSMASTQ